MNQRKARIVVIANLAAALVAAALLLVALSARPGRAVEPDSAQPRVALDSQAAQQAWSDARALSRSCAD
jgi:hypothetical protein